MDTKASQFEKLLGEFKWIENWEQLSVLSEVQLRRLYNHIGSLCFKQRLAYQTIKSLKFSQVTKAETVDREGNPFDLYHVEFDYTIEGSDKPKQVILNTW